MRTHFAFVSAKLSPPEVTVKMCTGDTTRKQLVAPPGEGILREALRLPKRQTTIGILLDS